MTAVDLWSCETVTDIHITATRMSGCATFLARFARRDVIFGRSSAEANVTKRAELFL